MTGVEWPDVTGGVATTPLRRDPGCNKAAMGATDDPPGKSVDKTGSGEAHSSESLKACVKVECASRTGRSLNPSAIAVANCSVAVTVQCGAGVGTQLFRGFFTV